MTYDAFPLRRDEVREEALNILSAIDASRRDRGAFEKNWRRLWQLVREAKAADISLEDPKHDLWHLGNHGDGADGASATLMAGDFTLPVWPPEGPRSRTDLPELLNWAGVPILVSNGRSPSRGGTDGDAAEVRRERAEQDRRRNEEGRQIAEQIRSRGEDLRKEEEDTRLTSEHLRDSQEAGRELAEVAREMAETLRRTALDVQASVGDMREVLAEIKELARKQRLVLERQEKALAAFDRRLRYSEPQLD